MTMMFQALAALMSVVMLMLFAATLVAVLGES